MIRREPDVLGELQTTGSNLFRELKNVRNTGFVGDTTDRATNFIKQSIIESVRLPFKLLFKPALGIGWDIAKGGVKTTADYAWRLAKSAPIIPTFRGEGPSMTSVNRLHYRRAGLPFPADTLPSPGHPGSRPWETDGSTHPERRAA